MKFVRLTIFFSVTSIYPLVAHSAAEDPVTFPDPNLQRAVETTLGIPNPTPADMLTLNTLEASSWGIVDLTGLEAAQNLTRLTVNYNFISSLAPIAGLAKLEYLSADYNGLTSLMPLTTLTALTHLQIRNNQCSDITPLNHLFQLQYLNLRHNGISDLSPLSGLTSLRSLYVYQNPITDLTPISSLTGLQVLWLNDNQVSDLSPIASFADLRQLGCRRNRVADISALQNLNRLWRVWLNANRISDISSLTNKTLLQSLQLDGNPLNTPAYCEHLQQILANNPALTDLTYDPNPNPISGDCCTELGDFARFSKQWLIDDCMPGNLWCDGADLDHNYKVDLSDLSILLTYWLNNPL